MVPHFSKPFVTRKHPLPLQNLQFKTRIQPWNLHSAFRLKPQWLKLLSTFPLLSMKTFRDSPTSVSQLVFLTTASNSTFDEPSEFEKRVTDMLESQVGTPTWQHIKAVDRETEQIAAWASWNTNK
ncbi:hypothetical protein TMatcc_005750 [Talaromyces marneffei ATCC 18224]|uniref:uncharacterized protein n=1 Tax=Talaromyces marneffei TaxID=37727 RepID=UPI0012A8A1CC|nr:uncharacterized protein EYB26_005735 [Talaromyces marneffei]QGA18057.1 hypothetical protein EYB26_005735 [Talaromyces marneffei]